jgi:hypothetical protein
MQIHTSKKACVGAYPTTLQNGIVWFWPNSDPQYKDILTEKKPPYIPEIDDPSYVSLMGNREIPYGYVKLYFFNYFDIKPCSTEGNNTPIYIYIYGVCVCFTYI